MVGRDSQGHEVSDRRLTLPLGLVGRDATNSTLSGHLYRASRSPQNAISSSSSTAAPARGTTKAFTASPVWGWGTPTTAAWATAGCPARTASTSAGTTLNPDTITRSFNR